MLFGRCCEASGNTCCLQRWTLGTRGVTDIRWDSTICQALKYHLLESIASATLAGRKVYKAWSNFPESCIWNIHSSASNTWQYWLLLHGVWVPAKAHVWRAEDSVGNHFSPSTMWALHLDFRSLDLPSTDVDDIILTCHPQIFKLEV